MEGGDQHGPLLRHDRLVPAPRQGDHAGSDAADPRRADEDHLELVARAVELDLTVGGERLALSAIRVALDVDVDEAERRLMRARDIAREENESRARAEDRLAGLVKLLERRHEAPLVHQLEERRRFAAGHDEAVEALELLGLADLHRLNTTTGERLDVERKVALERQDADLHRARSHARTVSAFLSGGKTGYQTWTMRPPSRYEAIRLISVVDSPSGTGNSNVGRRSACVSRSSASLRRSN